MPLLLTQRNWPAGVQFGQPLTELSDVVVASGGNVVSGHVAVVVSYAPSIVVCGNASALTISTLQIGGTPVSNVVVASSPAMPVAELPRDASTATPLTPKMAVAPTTPPTRRRWWRRARWRTSIIDGLLPLPRGRLANAPFNRRSISLSGTFSSLIR